MFSFLCRNAAPRARRNAYRPRIEGLEERKVMSVAAGALDAKSFYYINNNHELYYNHLDGLNVSHWKDVASNVAAVVAGTDQPLGSVSHETAFILRTNGDVIECHDLNGNLNNRADWNWVVNTKAGTLGVVQISASQITPNKVDMIFSDGELFSHVGTNTATGWAKLGDNVVKVQASQWAQGADDVFFLDRSGTVKVESDSPSAFGGQPRTVTLATGIKDISAAPRATAGDVFLLDTSGQLSLWTGANQAIDPTFNNGGGFITVYSTRTTIANNVASMSANDAYLQGSVFAVKGDGSLWEYQQAAKGGKFYGTHMADGVASISAVTPLGVRTSDEAFTLDNVYVQMKDGRVRRYTDALNPHASYITIS